MIFTRGIHLNISPTLSIVFAKLASEILKHFSFHRAPQILLFLMTRLIFVFRCYQVMECKDTGEGWDGSGGYDGECHVSTWPGHGVPRYWGEYDFWVSLWSYFQMRLAFESDWVKLTALPNMDRQHPIHWGPTEQKGEGGESVVPQCVWAVSWVFSWPLTGIFCHLFPGSQVFRFGLNYILLALLYLQLAGN